MLNEKKVSLIVAMSENNVIGIDNSLPWHLPNDLKFFKSNTMGKAIIMGRKTFESIGRPLPGRQNIILTRDESYHADGVTIAYHIEDAIAKSDARDAVIIGGANLYEQVMTVNCIDEMLLTRVHTEIEGDAFFPEFSEDDWTCVEKEAHSSDEAHDFDYTFFRYLRHPDK